jgi:hypothetical protein
LQDTVLEFAECMRDNGIDVPDPDPNSDDPTDAFGDVIDSDDTEVQAAVDKCQEVLEDTNGGQDVG